VLDLRAEFRELENRLIDAELSVNALNGGNYERKGRG
jgi:hypothetical protein